LRKVGEGYLGCVKHVCAQLISARFEGARWDDAPEAPARRVPAAARRIARRAEARRMGRLSADREHDPIPAGRRRRDSHPTPDEDFGTLRDAEALADDAGENSSFADDKNVLDRAGCRRPTSAETGKESGRIGKRAAQGLVAFAFVALEPMRVPNRRNVNGRTA